MGSSPSRSQISLSFPTGRCPEPLANYLETLVFNPTLRKSMGQEGRQWAESMGWDMVAKKITQAYASLSHSELTPVVGV